jgi:hypothetical protein
VTKFIGEANELVEFFQETTKILGSATVGAIFSGYLVARWKYREDSVEKRFDDLWVEISSTAISATDYWAAKATDPDLKIKAAKVMAGIARINGLTSTLAEFISGPASKEIALESSRFLRTATGGNFGVHNRDDDINRAAEILSAAALFAIECRRARLRDLKGLRRRR